MDNQNSTPAAYTLQPPANDLTQGYIEATPTTRLHLMHSGAVWLYDCDCQFEITQTTPGESKMWVWGALPMVIDPGSQWSDPVIVMASVCREIPSAAWVAAVAVIDHDLENENLKGPAPTPAPPMPTPPYDLRHHYLLNVA